MGIVKGPLSLVVGLFGGSGRLVLAEWERWCIQATVQAGWVGRHLLSPSVACCWSSLNSEDQGLLVWRCSPEASISSR